MQLSLELPNDVWTVSLCRRVARLLLAEREVEAQRAAEIELAVTEAAATVVRNTNPDSELYRLNLALLADRICMQVVAEGPGCIWTAGDEPFRDELDGRGLWMIEQWADILTLFTTSAGGCRLEAEFLLPQTCAATPSAPADPPPWFVLPPGDEPAPGDRPPA